MNTDPGSEICAESVQRLWISMDAAAENVKNTAVSRDLRKR